MDRISQLPDDLLIKILSSVPTKDAVAMSVLSKRWMSLWTLVPRLNIEDCWVDSEDFNEVYCKSKLVSSKLISKILLSHKSPVLESFYLKKLFKCRAWRIGLWVGIAVDRFVRDLRICFESEHCLIRLPSRLFRCETLETFELQRVIFLEVPFVFSLPSLRTLRLLYVKYADEDSFIRLISCSPVLENLVVASWDVDNLETVTINVPSLRSLVVSNRAEHFETHWRRTSNYRFVIHSHSLNQLDVVDEFGEVTVIGKMHNLVEANVNMRETEGNALESLTHVKSLSLTLVGEVEIPIGSIFFQLVRLEFHGHGENWWNSLMHVLHHSPILQFLKLDGMDHKPNKFCWIQPSSDGECLCCVGECLVHLKTFEWRRYAGTEHEKEMAIYIFKNAKRLVTASVLPSIVVNKHRVFKELEIATKGSRACELTWAE